MTKSVVIAGMGEVGAVIAAGARANGWDVREVRQGQSLTDAAAKSDGPIVLAMREDDFEAPFREANARRPGAVILVQNGFIDEVIAGVEHTRCVLWLTKKGDFVCNARETLSSGPWAEELSRWLSTKGVPARVESEGRVRREGLEKAAWSCLVGNGTFAYGRAFAELVRDDQDTARAIVNEACDVASRVLETEVTRAGAWAMVEQTREALGWMKGSAKGLAWRSGKVVKWAEESLGDGMAAVANGEVVRRVLAK